MPGEAAAAAAREAARPVPSPQTFFGFRPGRDGRYADWGGLSAYAEALAASSPRVRKLELGTTTEGRSLWGLALGPPDVVCDLDAIARRQGRRGEGGRPADGDAAGVAIVCVSCGVHAAEAAAPQGAADLAHALASASSPRGGAPLGRLLVLLLPAVDPDGLDGAVAWLAGGAGVGGAPRGLPAIPAGILRRYAGHDINRDWIMQTQPEIAAVVAGIHLRFLPHVTLDLHEMWPHGPRMFLPPYAPPADPAADPEVLERAGALGSAIAARLRAQRLQGIVSGQVFDAHSPARSFPHYHGGVRILCETATWADGRDEGPWRGRTGFAAVGPDGPGPDRAPEDGHARAWPAGPWTIADVLRYQQAAVWACLEAVAERAAEWDDWQGAVLARSRCGPERVGAFHIPAAQRDPSAAGELVRALRAGGLRVLPDGAGGSVVPRAQAFGRWADALLHPHPYPRGPAEFPPGSVPYDVTAHYLPALMGVSCRRDPESPPAAEGTAGATGPAEGATGMGGEAAPPPRPDPGPPGAAAAPSRAAGPAVDVWPAADTGSYARVLRALAAGEPVWAAESAEFGPAFIRAAGAAALPADCRAGARRLRAPAVAVYGSWKPGSDEGWLQHLLDRFGQPHATLRNADVREDGLRGRSHLILPSLRGRDILHGLPADRYPAGLAGGLGRVGAERIAEWVSGGGRLVAVEWAAAWAQAALPLPARDLTAGPARDTVSHGALLGIEPVRPARGRAGRPVGALAFGAPDRSWVLYRGGPALVGMPAGCAAARFTAEPPVAGWAERAERLAGAAAVADLPLGRGRCTLFAFSPYFRAQAWASFRWLFNALLC